MYQYLVERITHAAHKFGIKSTQIITVSID